MDHPFVVGQVYKNRNGAYEVVAIDNREHTVGIRYLESDEEVEVSIPLQARIWRNLGWEEQDEVRRQAEEDLRQQRGYGEEFTGLTPTDFKTRVEGTRWRSRRGLAGRVARLLTDASSDPPYTFLTWAIYRWPVAFLAHREYYEMASQRQGSCGRSSRSNSTTNMLITVSTLKEAHRIGAVTGIGCVFIVL